MAEEGHQGSFRTSVNGFLCTYGSEARILLSNENLVCRKENLDHEWAIFAGSPDQLMRELMRCLECDIPTNPPTLPCCYGSHELLLRYAGNLASLPSQYFFRAYSKQFLENHLSFSYGLLDSFFSVFSVLPLSPRDAAPNHALSRVCGNLSFSRCCFHPRFWPQWTLSGLSDAR